MAAATTITRTNPVSLEMAVAKLMKAAPRASDVCRLSIRPLPARSGSGGGRRSRGRWDHRVSPVAQSVVARDSFVRLSQREGKRDPAHHGLGLVHGRHL